MLQLVKEREAAQSEAGEEVAPLVDGADVLEAGMAELQGLLEGMVTLADVESQMPAVVHTASALAVLGMDMEEVQTRIKDTLEKLAEQHAAAEAEAATEGEAAPMENALRGSVEGTARTRANSSELLERVNSTVEAPPLWAKSGPIGSGNGDPRRGWGRRPPPHPNPHWMGGGHLGAGELGRGAKGLE